MVFSGIVEEMGTVVSMVKVPEITLWDGSKGEGWLLKINAKKLSLRGVQTVALSQ